MCGGGQNSAVNCLKAISAFLVCYAHYNSFSGIDVQYWFNLEGIVGYTLLAVAAHAVPLFLIINGYLVINKRYKLHQYLKKTLHVLCITIAWCALYNLIFNVVFSEYHTAKELLYSVWQGIYSGEYISIRNWYFYTLGSIYMLLPFITIAFLEENINLSSYLFWIVFIFTIGTDSAEKILYFINPGISIYADIIPRINILAGWDAFALMYFVMGGVLKKKDKSLEKRNFLYVKCCVGAVAFILSVLYGMLYMKRFGEYYDIIWNGYSMVTLLISSTVAFVLMLHADIKISVIWEKIAAVIARNSMGIYFIHLVIGTLLKPQYLSLPMHNDLYAGVLFALMVFLASLICSETLRRIPLVKYLVSLK